MVPSRLWLWRVVCEIRRHTLRMGEREQGGRKEEMEGGRVGGREGRRETGRDVWRMGGMEVYRMRRREK